MDITTTMVVGAGQMGSGIAQVVAGAGLQVLLYDIDQSFIDRALAQISQGLNRLLAKGKISDEERAQLLGRIEPSTSLQHGTQVDFIIEAAPENMELKKEIFQTLDKVTRQSVILATNTSSLSITELASFTSRPEKVIGMHFMNPVRVMPLVEVIRGISTSDHTFNSVKNLAIQLSKQPVEVNDFPGFISNRLLMPMINEAVYCIYEGVAEADAIDKVMKLGMNHPMGPLALADLIGLDTCLAIMEVLYHGFSDSKYRPCPLLTKMVKAGWLGRKTGKGFFQY